MSNAKHPTTPVAATGSIEARLLAEPAEAYMSPAQLKYFRERLHAERAALLQSSREPESPPPVRELLPDPVDRAILLEDEKLELSTLEHERAALREIDAALQRIEDGRYGWCEETGEAIGLERLLACPTATLSVEAQTRRERRQKMAAR